MSKVWQGEENMKNFNTEVDLMDIAQSSITCQRTDCI